MHVIVIVRGSHGACYQQLPSSEPCKMAQGQSLVRATDRLLHARSGGHRAPPAPSRRALRTREEITSGIWRSPALKRKSATRLGQRTITSTPNIILDRCPRIQKERKSRCCDAHPAVRANSMTKGEHVAPAMFGLGRGRAYRKGRSRLPRSALASGPSYDLWANL
jgi:hypothetical protein